MSCANAKLSLSLFLFLFLSFSFYPSLALCITRVAVAFFSQTQLHSPFLANDGRKFTLSVESKKKETEINVEAPWKFIEAHKNSVQHAVHKLSSKQLISLTI